MIKYIFPFVFCIALAGCLGRKKSAGYRYISNSHPHALIKTAGYYYNIKEGYRKRYFFYENGRMLDADGCICKDESEMIAKESDVKSAYFLKSISDSNNIRWTNYYVKNDSIFFERIFPMQNYPHTIYSGRVLNDSTFLITSGRGVFNSDTKTASLNDTFHFKRSDNIPALPL